MKTMARLPPVLVVLLAVASATTTLALPDANDNTFLTSGANSDIFLSSSSEQHPRSLQEADHHDHDHDEIASSFQWAGIFHFHAEVYTLTVKVPGEGGDEHEGHNHRRLAVERRGLQEDADDHSDHDHEGHDHDEDHEDHDEDHEDHDTSTAQEFHFLMALVPVSEEGQAGIDEAWGIVNAMEENHNTSDAVIELHQGDIITPSTEYTYELFLEDDISTSSFSINITQETDITGTHYVLFLPGSPGELEGDNVHFLLDAEGTNVWPETIRLLQKESTTTQTSGREGAKKPWGTVIGATFLINLITLVGVIFLVPVLSTAFKNKTLGKALKDLTTSSDIIVYTEKRNLFDIAITAFACGALLATTVFLIVPEAIILVNSSSEEGSQGGDSHEGHNHRMLQDDHEGHDHGDRTWVFGTCLLAGFILPMFLASFFPHHHHHEPLESAHAHDIVTTGEAHVELGEPNNTDDANAKNAHKNDDDNHQSSEGKRLEEEETEETRCMKEDEGSVVKEEETEDEVEIDTRLVSTILLGDALHNFADGIFIGVAFLLCDTALGWSIVASTIYHELAQEVSDFFLLTQRAHLPPIIALGLNFASGLSVTLGGIIVLATDVSNFVIGVILSMSAGIYIYVSAKECMPTVDQLAVTLKDRVLAFFFFALGAIPIGLVLLNHEHCEG